MAMAMMGRLQQGWQRSELVVIYIYMLRGSSLLPDTETADPEVQFQLLDYLGQGAYGSVSKALHKSTGNLYAIKILPATTHSELATIKKEIQILKLCDNEHIVKYYGSYFKDGKLWIVLEYCHAGSIIDLINITQRKLNQNEIASILESVIEGLAYLHASKKIHRDIKAANILLNNEGVAKLADFGVSTQSMYTNARHRSQVGSPYWMSPEVLRNSEYTNKTDIWSLGVTAIELAEGVVPNSHIKPYVAIFQLKEKPTQGFQQPEKWSPEFNAFVKECLNTNPALRPEAKALLKHEFIVKYSRGQRLLAELVQNSLSDIQQFRRGEEDNYDGSEFDILNMINASGMGTKTIVNNHTERSQVSQEKELLRELGEDQVGNSSMVINQNDASMIINNSAVGDEREKPSAFLNKYINGLKNSENEVQTQKQAMKRKIAEYDANCLTEIQQVFAKYKAIIGELLNTSTGDQFVPMDAGFIKDEIGSKLHKSDNIKQFLVQFPKYEQKKKEAAVPVVKQFERSQLAKKKSQCSQMAHHSTQTTDPPGYADVSQFREIYRGVRSQQFNETEFRTNQKQHCFNSKSIISDMENVKYKDYPEQRFCKADRSGKRLIMTQPPEWPPNETRPFQHQISKETANRIKNQFAGELVMNSLGKYLSRATHNYQPTTVKHDRVAESTLYHQCEQDTTFKNSVTILRGRDFAKNSTDLIPRQQQQDQNEINMFEATKNSGKNSKNQPKKKSKGLKRVGSNEKRPGLGKSNNARKHGK